ncbi:MAG: YggT family protein [Micropepsaceae bacterium]
MIELLILLINLAVKLYFWVIVITVVLSWLIGLNIVNGHRPEVRAVQRVCYQLTEPLLGPIRRRMPAIGGLDLSPIVLLLGLEVVQILLIKMLTGTLI